MLSKRSTIKFWALFQKEGLLSFKVTQSMQSKLSNSAHLEWIHSRRKAGNELFFLNIKIIISSRSCPLPLSVINEFLLNV